MALLTSCQETFLNVFDGFSVEMGNTSLSVPCRIDGKPTESMDVEVAFWGLWGKEMRPCTVTVGTLPQGMTLTSNIGATAETRGKMVFHLDSEIALGAGSASGFFPLTFLVEKKAIVKNFNWVKVYDAKEFNAIREEIKNAATNVTTGTTTYTENLVDGLKKTIASMYVSRVDGEETTVAQLKSFVTSQLEATSEAYNIKFAKSDDISTYVNKVMTEYSQNVETYIRFSAEGIEIGKKENSDTLPYSVLLSNEKLSFRSYGVEVAYVQYNKLYITSADVLDKISVGSAANGGYFDFITTSTGMGLKWRDV